MGFNGFPGSGGPPQGGHPGGLSPAGVSATATGVDGADGRLFGRRERPGRTGPGGHVSRDQQRAGARHWTCARGRDGRRRRPHRRLRHRRRRRGRHVRVHRGEAGADPSRRVVRCAAEDRPVGRPRVVPDRCAVPGCAGVRDRPRSRSRAGRGSRRNGCSVPRRTGDGRAGGHCGRQEPDRGRGGHRPHEVEAAAFTADAIATRRRSAEGQEGLRAFLDKRPPRWSR